MLAARLPGTLPPLDATEALEVSMIQLVAGLLLVGRITRKLPMRDPLHSTSLPALATIVRVLAIGLIWSAVTTRDDDTNEG